MKWLILILGILANASASVLVKISVTPPRKFPSMNDLWGALTNWPFWLGLALYGAAFFLYTAALARIPLNLAHPILTAGSIAIVAFCSFFIFNEPFLWSTVTGIFLVIAGVTLISLRLG